MSSSLTYHVINRGVIGQDIFHAQEDADFFITIVKKYSKIRSFNVYHWCLMHNHYHLVLGLKNSAGLSKIIGAIQQIYASYHHRVYKTQGRLFQSRFKSQAIETAAYLLACGRYVERNPVRAGLVSAAWQWPWSSARFYVYKKEDGITTISVELAERSPQEHMRWLSAGDAESEKMFHGNCAVIGNDGFTATVEKIGDRFYPKLRGRKRKGEMISQPFDNKRVIKGVPF